MTIFEYAIAQVWYKLNEAKTKRRLTPGEQEFLERAAPVMKRLTQKDRLVQEVRK